MRSCRVTFTTSVALLAFSCVSLVSCSGGATQELTTLPLLSCSGLPCVDVKFGHSHLRLLLNLASGRSYLTAQGLTKADVDRPKNQLGKARHFKLGSLELSDLFYLDDTLGHSIASAAEALAPPADGSLSYNSFGERLLVLNIREHVIKLSTNLLKTSACPGICSQLKDSRSGDMGSGLTLTSDGFTAGKSQLRTRIDTLFQGSIVLLEPVSGLTGQPGSPVDGTYRGDKLLLIQTAPVYFGGRQLATSAQITRADQSYGQAGRAYDSAVGLKLLGTGAYAFDLRSMKMWRDDAAGR